VIISIFYRLSKFDCFVIIMFLGNGKFEFGYDLLHHGAYCNYCIVHETVIEASKKFKSSKKY